MNVKIGFRHMLAEAEWDIDSIAAAAIGLRGKPDVTFIDRREADERHLGFTRNDGRSIIFRWRHDGGPARPDRVAATRRWRMRRR